MADEQNNWAPQGDQNAQPQRDAQETQNIPSPANAASARAAAEQPTETIAPVEGASQGAATPSGTSAPSDAQQSQPAQPAYGQYRPAPEYGAYGPVPTAGQSAGQPGPFDPTAGASNAGQPQYGQNAGFGGFQPRQNRNPYPVQPAASSNPFAPESGQQTPEQQTPQTPQYGQTPQGDQNAQNDQGAPAGPANPFGGAPANPFGPQDGPDFPGQPGQPGAPQTPVKAKSGVGRFVVTGVVAALVSAALCLGVGYAAITSGAVKITTTSSLASVDSSKSGSGSASSQAGESVDWSAVAKEVSGAVVSIQTQTSNGTAQGSGAILDTEGHIVTNNHVISDAQKIQVTLSNGQMYSAQIVGADTTTDLAVIKLDNPPSDLKTVTFADSDKLAVGENIMAVGNPLGYDDTATAGIVSALNRPVSVMDDNNNDIVTNAVQIDAAINPGNSGGPTFNTDGQVIGINSSIASTSSGSSSSTSGSIGIGFAIPSNLVKRVANEIITNGSVKHVALGITITSDTVEADGVTRSGAKITKGSSGSAVVSGSPADKAGLKEGDTIVAFNGNAVNSNASLLGFVRAAALGDKATLTIVRNGVTMEVNVTLDQQEEAVNGTNRSESSNGNSGSNGNGNGNGNSNGNGNGGQSDGNGNSDGSDGGSDSFGFPFGW